MSKISQWTVYTDKSHAIHRGGMTASIGRNRNLYLNREVFQALRGPLAVELMFDEFNKWIGIKKADPNLPYSRKVRLHSRDKGYCVTMAGFMTRFGIKIGATVRFPHCFVDTNGVLILDLKRTIITSRPTPKFPTTI